MKWENREKGEFASFNLVFVDFAMPKKPRTEGPHKFIIGCSRLFSLH